MNTNRDLAKRLLKLYPVKSIKEHFDTDLNADELYDNLVQNNNFNAIKDFAYGNLEDTKRHIYVYSIGQAATLQNINLRNFPFDIINQTNINNEISLTISPIVDFNTVLNNPFEEVTMKFHQPTKIVLNRTHLVFYFTILEKNINSHFDNNRKVLNVDKLNEESETITLVFNHLNHLNPQICDLNRGVKHLWNADIVDSKYAKWKKHRSTTTETMDESYTLKSQYPEVYQTIINAPLNKTIFKYLIADENLPEHFTIDPSVGQISVPIFPKHINQHQNVVREILSNN